MEISMAQTIADQAPTSLMREPPRAPRVKISARFLLGIYAVLPLCLLAMLLDRYFWGGTIVRHLPTTPESFFIFQLLFGTPHIIASSVLLLSNGEYVRAYGLRLVLITLVILAFFGIGSLFIPYDVFLAIVGALTVLHVLKQQVGIGKGICRLSGGVYEVWGWTLIASGSILYYTLYAGGDFSAETTRWIHRVLWTLSALTVILTLVCHVRIATPLGRLYLWANTVMGLQSALFYAEGYSFLAILGPRLVHDLTAFTFYVAHDVNRHGAVPQNWLYRAASKLGLGIYWVCPMVAVLLTYLISRFSDPAAEWVTARFGYHLPYLASFLIVGYLGLLHYYTEVFTWRHGSPYRRHIAMTT
jgi:hypothetical protein